MYADRGRERAEGFTWDNAFDRWLDVLDYQRPEGATNDAQDDHHDNGENAEVPLVVVHDERVAA